MPAVRPHWERSLHVTAVHSSAEHVFSKSTVRSILLVEGHGIRGDAHCGQTVKHRSRVAKDPTKPNLRQIHLLQQELLSELQRNGFAVAPGQMGENVTTHGLNLLALSAGTRLLLSSEALVEITGLRNPCHQIESFMPGLLAAVLERSPNGTLLRKAGVMGIVLNGGIVEAGAPITLVHVPSVHVSLQPV
jgi:MOSC domain-containing protein YiiM